MLFLFWQSIELLFWENISNQYLYLSSIGAWVNPIENNVTESFTFRMSLAVDCLRVAAFIAFITWDLLHKGALTLFVNYQDYTGAQQMIVYKDLLQEAERERLNKTLKSIFAVTTILVTIAILILMPFIPIVVMMVVYNLALVAVISFFLRWIFYAHVDFFQVLYKRRKYEFKSFHAKREIPLAAIT